MQGLIFDLWIDMNTLGTCMYTPELDGCAQAGTLPAPCDSEQGVPLEIFDSSPLILLNQLVKQLLLSSHEPVPRERGRSELGAKIECEDGKHAKQLHCHPHSEGARSEGARKGGVGVYDQSDNSLNR